jgi:hypothetical protein
LARRVVGDQLNAERLERPNELHQRIDVAANDAVAGFHALDGRQRQSSRFSERPLIDTEKGARRPELARCNHAIESEITSEVMFHTSIFVKIKCIMMLPVTTVDCPSRVFNNDESALS